MIFKADLFYEELILHIDHVHHQISWMGIKEICENSHDPREGGLPYFQDVKSEMLGTLALFSLMTEPPIDVQLKYPPFPVPYALHRVQKQPQVSHQSMVCNSL